MRARIPALISLKYERMAESPFSFFRGAVPVMAYDLSLSPNTGLINQICGDAHIRNLGAYAAPDGRLVFDINDFDETIQGPFEWDLKRLATSLILAARQGGAEGNSDREAARTFLRRYCRFTRSFAEMTVLEIAQFQVHRLRDVEPVSGILGKAERSTPMHTLEALTEPRGLTIRTRNAEGELHRGKPAFIPNRAENIKKKRSGESPERVFRSAPPILERVTGKAAQRILEGLTTYRDSLQPERQHFLDLFRPLDVAFKVVGTGSVALRDYCVYLQGNGSGDTLFLQIKEERASAYTPYIAGTPIDHHHGRRVVDGQRAMQLQSDPFLGWTSIDGRDYLVRQLNDHKASIDLEDLSGAALIAYATVCGEILARGHARSGDACALAGYIGRTARFEEAVLKFASAYADQTERDWKQLVRARRKQA